MSPPHAFISSYAPRLRTYGNSLLTPVIQPSTGQGAPGARTTKRGTLAVNYAEDNFDDDDFEDSEGPRRPTGLRSLRREDSTQEKASLAEKLGTELTSPVELQGIWRDWMGRPKFGRSERQLHAQTALPLTLIPIRIDLDIPAFTPQAALPLPINAHDFNINPALPAYRTPEQTPPYRLKDVFLWNLHETLMTPDQFASIMVNDLDLPNPAALTVQISNQIRQQLEEYAGVALHPLFHTAHSANNPGQKPVRGSLSRAHSNTPASPAGTPLTIGHLKTNGYASPSKGSDAITASATPLQASSDEHNPDDTYRCIVTLSINLQNQLYTDKFEWSLLHPPGLAEKFAKQTCADLGLAGEWVPAMTHAIYEAVLRLKKEACESGGLVGGLGYGGEIDNLAAGGKEAGWRYDNEHLADEWEPRVETLSKEEIEKREGDRERQIRRLRRETARFSSTANMAGGMPSTGGYFDLPDPTETPMGRGERSKKKRRFRSLSPSGRGGTPGGRGTPDTGVAGYGGGGGLSEWERQSWRCAHCMVWGSGVWTARDGPSGQRSLCNNCGLIFERDKRLPPWSKALHKNDLPPVVR
ncbi:SNF5-domain-containing protein [Xylona heveae TC161]|uniref:SNF5-domain-containing protein n=1 Tax=Xylona heveae (strain CBS 132557 / TC161) TaxID=1328760 RepID=A0A165JK90_XYLHT|nr:SNF5-domain-containing protein [Xylona heveae TC161]KZF26338.1 SNF5-domain-containing protein [Xylona heveae TC161]